MISIADDLQTHAADGLNGAAPVGSLPLVLVIEDNHDMRQYIRANLKDLYSIDEAVDGELGIAKAAETIPDLVISDVMMPKLNGFEVCRKLKTDERTSHVPVILLTAKAEPDHRIEGLETGADDYLVKPFDPKELRMRVKNLIEQRKRLREKYGKNPVLGLKEISATPMDEQFLRRAIKVAEEHISDLDFTADKFAREMFMSRMQLHRKLKALTDRSAWEFFRSIRLESAARLLRKRTGNIAEIAHRSGYENPAHFAEAFRKHFGKTPSDFMNQD
jgi:DNA-binding response OmpR family regulator